MESLNTNIKNKFNVNKSTKQTKSQKGITLIALIVTIIVLIILAGISVTTLTGKKSIINQAENTGNNAQRESIIEKIEADLMKEKIKTGDTPTLDELKAIIEKNEYNEGILGDKSFVTKDGGYTINYDEIIGWGDYLTIDDLKVGDKVYYDTGNTSVGDNGIIECVVLYDKKYNDENETNYGVQIISTDVVDTVKLGDTDFNKARNSYNNVLQTLYNKAQEYLNPTYASGARCVGSKPNDPDWDTEEMSVADDSYTYMKAYNKTFKVGDNNYNTDWTQMGTITNVNIKTASSEYVLASRYVTYSTGYGGFYIRYSYASGYLIGTAMIRNKF